MKKLVKGHGGMVAYLGTHDIRNVEEKIEKGDQKAKQVYEGMAYQISKEIGAAATVVSGRIDGIILTGGLAHSTKFTALIKDRIQFIGPVFILPGEQEMKALAMGALRVLNGTEKIKMYQFG
jgi:butyrate kinase